MLFANFLVRSQDRSGKLPLCRSFSWRREGAGSGDYRLEAHKWQLTACMEKLAAELALKAV